MNLTDPKKRVSPPLDLTRGPNWWYHERRKPTDKERVANERIKRALDALRVTRANAR